MILLDLSQTLYSCYFAMPEEDRQTDLLRHVIYNTVRSTKKMWQPRGYGRMVVAADGPGSWRKSVFPQYKARRSKAKKEDDKDWDDVFGMFNTIRDEFRDYFPYKFIHVDGAEGDDVIATLILRDKSSKHLIVSSDKDFKQLHELGPHIAQYDPINKRHIRDKSFDKLEFILRGDTSDGVPNVLTEDDVFVSGGRQKPMTKKKLEELRSLPVEPDNENYKRFVRNSTVMDLEKVPDDLQEEIVKQFKMEREPKASLFDLFREKKLKRLMESIDDFQESERDTR